MTNPKKANSLLDISSVLTQAGLGKGMKVADMGCGATGHFVFPASQIVGAEGKVYAIDVIKATLKNIKHRIKQENRQNIEAIWSNLEIFNATPIESSSLDCTLLINTLYQSNKKVEIIKETIRMLKKGGLLTIVDWKNIDSPFGPPNKERVLKDALIEAAPRLGLKTKKEFSAGDYHYGLIFEKL